MALTPKPKSPALVQALSGAALAGALVLGACSETDTEDAKPIDAATQNNDATQGTIDARVADATASAPDANITIDAGRSDGMQPPPMPPPMPPPQ